MDTENSDLSCRCNLKSSSAFVQYNVLKNACDPVRIVKFLTSIRSEFELQLRLVINFT